jgi:signal transduction histidine kinase/ligand-binding sensor domain-containing protein
MRIRKASPVGVLLAVRLWLIAAVFIPGLTALAAVSTNTAWSVRVWQSDDGLPNNIVTGLAQTRDGYLWVANPTRLARFDGVQFEQLPGRTLAGGFNQRITTLADSHDGALWLATDRGVVARVDAGSVVQYTNNLPALFVESLTEDGAGAIWVKNRGGNTISRIQNGQVTQLPLVGGYRSVATDSQGRLWFIRNGEVGLFRNGQFETLLQLGKTVPTRLVGSKNGGVWICLGAELFKVEEGKAPVDCGAFAAESTGMEPTVLLEDRDGALWIGTSDSGLFRYDGKVFENIPVSHRQILSLLQDREGNFWAGTGGGGLDRIQPRAVALEGMESSLPFETVQSLTQDTNGIVWAATLNGLLVCRTNGDWRTVSAETGWPGGRVACVTADRSGNLWIATRNRRVYRLHEGQYTVFQSGNGMTVRSLHVLLATSKGDVWIAGTGPDASVQCFRDGNFETLAIPPDAQVVHSMVEDGHGDIWLGTSRGYLLRIHDDVVTDETASTGVMLSIRCLQTTPDGSLWIGYAGGGVGRLKDGHYIRVTSAQGVYDDHVSQIVADDRGWLWLGSDHGIFKIRQQQFDALAQKSINHVISVHYGPGEGLAGLQANFGESPGVLRGADGRLWLPMRTALVVINPASLRENSEPPPALLKQMIVDDKVAAQFGTILPASEMVDAPPAKDTLRLPPDHRHLEFIFTALSFNAPENIRFQYRLQGFDSDWVDAGTERRVSYSRLATGAYRFLVRACNSDGVWGDGGAGLAFIVAPFFWQTWWFWCLTLAFFTTVVVAVVRFVSHRQLRLQVQALERQAALDRERTRIARDIHDDIGNLLTQVTLLGGLTLRDRAAPDKTLEHAQQISSTIEQVTNSLDEIVWAVNPRNDTLPQLIDYLGQFAVEFLSTAGITCRVDLPDHPPHRPVSSDVRHNLFLVVKEALNNVARHSGAAEVVLRVAVAEQDLEVTIQDNGKSFDPAAVNGSSNGLRNMRQRMDELGGKFEVGHNPGGGTRIWLFVPTTQRN